MIKQKLIIGKQIYLRSKAIKKVICVVFSFVIITLNCPVFAESSLDPGVTLTSDFTFSAIGDFVKHIFVPSDNYFHNKFCELNNNANEKLGGVAYLFHSINYFFKTLNNAPVQNFDVNVPSGLFGANYQGFKQNLFIYSSPFIRILRLSMTGFLCILTSIVCYKKLVKIFKEG